MSGKTIVTMVAILGVVWGGFALILATAVRNERRKQEVTAGGEGGSE